MCRPCLLCTARVVAPLMLTSTAPPAGGGGTAAPTGDWMSRAIQGIAMSEFHFSPALGGAFSAPNRAQGLRVRADGRGVQVTPRTQDCPSWALDLHLQRMGREGALVGAQAGTLRIDGNRIEERREAPGLAAWAVNHPGGLAQGFTTDPRP